VILDTKPQDRKQTHNHNFMGTAIEPIKDPTDDEYKRQYMIRYIDRKLGTSSKEKKN